MVELHDIRIEIQNRKLKNMGMEDYVAVFDGTGKECVEENDR